MRIDSDALNKHIGMKRVCNSVVNHGWKRDEKVRVNIKNIDILGKILKK